MNNWIVVMGGCGSCYLSDTLHKKGYFYAYRPDIAINVLQERPDNSTIGLFKSKGLGYQFSKKLTCEINFLNFIEKLKKNPEIPAIFGKAHMWKFFSKYSINKLIYLVRHPEHGYISLLNKHPEMFKGKQNEHSVRFYAEIWNNLVSECLETSGRFIRFEFAVEDSKDTWWHPFFERWRENLRHNNELNKDLVDLLKELVWSNFNRVYSHWEI